MTNENKHYKQYTIEPIDFIHLLDLNFNIGNVVKYIIRRNFKKELKEDLKKAAQYLYFEIKRRMDCSYVAAAMGKETPDFRYQMPLLQEHRDIINRFLFELKEKDSRGWRILQETIFTNDLDQALRLIENYYIDDKEPWGE
jgi:predicted nucleotidyltransferase